MANKKDTWSSTECIKLIDLYRQEVVLWDTSNEYYYSTVKKKDSWANISQQMGIPVADIMKKMKSLLSSFRSQKAKATKSVGTGKGRKEIYVSKWFAFKSMLFLIDRDKPRLTADTIEQDLDNGSDHCVVDDIDEHIAEETLDDNNSDIGVDEEYESAPCDEIANPEIALNEDGQGSPDLQANSQHLKTQVSVCSTSNLKNKNSGHGRSRRNAAEGKKEDQHLNRAFQLLEKVAAAETSPKSQQDGLRVINDKHTTFALHIAEKLREYSPLTVSHVQFEINNILFAADLGKYENRDSTFNPYGHGSTLKESLGHTRPTTPHSYASTDQDSSSSYPSGSSTSLHQIQAPTPTPGSSATQHHQSLSAASHPPDTYTSTCLNAEINVPVHTLDSVIME